MTGEPGMPHAHDVARELGGAVRKAEGWLCRCPVKGHGRGRGDKNPSLSVMDGARGLVWKCFAGCSQKEVQDELARRGLLDERNGGRPSGRPSAVGAGAARAPMLVAGSEANREAAYRIWRAAVPAAGTLVEAYLEARGLPLPACKAIRFSPALRHPTGSDWPAMVCAVQGPNGRFMGVHRTFLARDGQGKAPVSPAKMSLGPIAGGAVRLGPAADGMLVGEGVETTIAGMAVSGRPGWASLSTSGMKTLVLPEGVKEVRVLVDADEPGEKAALAATARWQGEGRTVRVARPPSPCKDFNDALAGAMSRGRAQ